MKSRNTGFSLIELLVVIAIAGILFSIAIPAYQQYLLSANRTDAIKTLLEVSNSEGEYYTQYNQYTTALTALGYASDNVTSGNGDYVVTVTSAQPQTFTLTATAQGGQVQDTHCGNFTLTSLGIKGVTGTEGTTHCWQ
jgi:type IV pilus assembly protein PilE